jgi:hypothetical protein
MDNATTRHNERRERLLLCPACGRWVHVLSFQDDTRWRYGTHLSEESALCVMSRDLYATTGSPPPAP